MTKQPTRIFDQIAKNFIHMFFLSLSIILGLLYQLLGDSHQHWFDSYQRDTESLIIGRMVKSGQDGILSDGGLTGFGNINPAPR